MIENLYLLPEVIVNYEIFKFLSYEKLLFTSKKYYEPNIIKYRLTNKNFSYKRLGFLDNYIKKLLINKYDYIFSLLIREKYKHWVNIKKYKYKGYKYNSYMDLLDQLCIENQSTKCRNCILDYEKTNGSLRKNKYKKMRRINNIWSN